MKSFIKYVIFIILLLSFLYSRPFIESDGCSYYAITEGLVKDHSFNLVNQIHLKDDCVQYAVNYNSKTSRYVSSYAPGFAVFYAPFLAIFAYLHDDFGFLSSIDAYSISIKGMPFAYSLSILIGSLFFSFLTLYIIYAILKENFDDKIVSYSILLVYASILIAYAATFPSFLHSLETFLVTMSFYIFIKRDKIYFNNINFSYILLAISIGSLFIVRNIDAILAFPYIIYLTYEEGYIKKNYKNLIRILGELAIGVLPFILFSVYYNTLQYGSYSPSPYIEAGVLDPFPYYTLNYLFDPLRGIFIWAPVTIFSFAGLLYLYKTKKEYGFISILSILLALVAYGFYNRWWAGLCFGQRYLTMLFPFFVCGLTAFIANKKWALKYAIVLAIFPMVLLNIYLININTDQGSWLLQSEMYTPYDLIKTSYAEYNQQKQPVGSFLYEKIFGGNEPTTIYGIMRVLGGNGPVVISNFSELQAPANKNVYRMVIYSYSEKEIRVGIDIWDKNNPVHPEGHLSWFISKPFKVTKGENIVLINYEFGNVSFFNTKGNWELGEQGWISDFREPLLSKNRLFFVHGTLYSDAQVKIKRIEHLYTLQS